MDRRIFRFLRWNRRRDDDEEAADDSDADGDEVGKWIYWLSPFVTRNCRTAKFYRRSTTRR